MVFGYIRKLLLLLFLFTSSTYAETVVYDGHRAIPLLPHLSFWLPESPSNYDEALSHYRNGQFQPLTLSSTHYLASEIWYHFSLKNDTASTQDLILNFNEVFYNSIAVFYQYQGKRHRYQTGIDDNYASRPIKYRLFAFPIELSANSSVEVFFKIQPSRFATVYPVIQSNNRFIENSWISTLYSVTPVFILFFCLIYFSIITKSTDEQTLIRYFIISVVAQILISLHNDGYLLFLTSDRFISGEQFLLFLIAINSIAICLLLQALFKLKIQSRVLYIGTVLCIALWSATLLANAINNSQLITAVSELSNRFTLLTYLSIGGYALYRKWDAAIYYGLGLIIYLSLVGWTMLSFIGIVEMAAWNKNIPVIANSILTLFFAGAIASKVNKTRREKRKLRQDAEIIEAKNAAKTTFLATMSHEIRTPINGLLGMAQALEKTDLDSRQSKYVEVLLSSCNSLLNVINDILDFSKVESGKIELETISFNVDELIAMLGTTFETIACEKSFIFYYQLSANAPVFLVGDQSRIQQILNNLLSNAFKFTEQGEVAITYSLIKKISPTKARVRFSVIDTGIGIQQEKIATLFDPYVQAESSTTRQYGGTGLGLSICKQLVTAMNGNINAISTPGEGTEFWFEIDVGIDTEKQSCWEDTLAGLADKKIGILLRNSPYKDNIVKNLENYQLQVVDHVTETNISELDIIIVSTLMLNEKASLLSITENTQKPFILLDYKLTKGSEYDHYPANIHLLTAPSGMYQIIMTIARLLLDQKADVKPTHRLGTEAANTEVPELKILAVEDNIVNQNVLEAFLKAMKLKADYAANGIEALKIIEDSEYRYDVILMDCEMPEMDGYEATKKIRQLEQQHDLEATTIFALTAHALPERIEHCISCGMNDVITKPILYETLKDKLYSVKALSDQPLSIASQ